MARAVWVDQEGNRYHRHFDFSVTTSRETGIKIQIEVDADVQGYNYTVKCLKHGSASMEVTLAEAKEAASHPTSWCYECDHDLHHKGDWDTCSVQICKDRAWDGAPLVFDTSDVKVGTFYRYEPIEVAV